MRSNALEDLLAPHLSATVRGALEERYWRVIERRAETDQFLFDPSVLDGSEHPALFADHGVVHVRDVAAGVLELFAVVDGLLVSGRSDERRRTVQSVAVATAYLHDIGMIETNARGRRVHPQWAAQEVFRQGFDELIEQLVADEQALVNGVRAAAPFEVPESTVIREVLAMSMCHSKSVVPASLLDDHAALRAAMCAAVFVPLDEQQPGDRSVRGVDDQHPTSPAAVHYSDQLQAFAWLDSTEPHQQALADDVIDAMRLVRAADALRQRGTTLRTSAGYEMFLDPATADVVYAMRSQVVDNTVHLRVSSSIGGGEATIRRTAVTSHGHLRVWFHVVSFGDPVVRRRAATNAAIVLLDVLADVLAAFATATSGEGLTPPSMHGSDMRVELAGDGSEASFAHEVARRISERRPDIGDRVVVVDDDYTAPRTDAAEHDRYRAARAVVFEPELAAELVAGFRARHSSPSGRVNDPSSDDARVLHLGAGEVLIEAGTASDFVYLPLTEGLQVLPIGGYGAMMLPPFELVGATGAVRRGERNATVHATQPLDVVVIPSATFTQSWFQPFTLEELVAVISGHTS